MLTLHAVDPTHFNKPWDVFELERIIEPIQRVKDHIGLVVVGGFLEMFSFDGNPEALKIARTHCDGLAVWFMENATYPPLVRGTVRGTVVQTFQDVDHYYQMPIIFKKFIEGVEIQLSRRVYAVGTHIKWIMVPTSHEERYHSPGEPEAI